MRLAEAKHAFITGGASGIGLGVARALAERGIRVTIADIDPDAIQAVLGVEGDGFRGARLDVSDRAQWADVKAQAEAAFGPVDILFNNAGIASFGYELVDMAPDAFDRVVAVNLTGVFNGISAFAGGMRERRRGHIVNTSSMAGISGPSGTSGGSYAAAKAGVVALTEMLRSELASYDVGASVLCPGVIATGIARTSARNGGDLRLPPGHDAGAKSKARMTAYESGGVDQLVPHVLRGIEENAPYIISHGGGWLPLVEARHNAIEAAFEGSSDAG